MNFPSHRDVLAVTQDTNHKKYLKDPCKTQNHHIASYIHTYRYIIMYIYTVNSQQN